MSAQLDEQARQRDLDRYRLLDSLPEQAYDDIVQLASMLCDAPIALVTLIDRDRQWFKASTGIDGEGTRRDEAFCNHAIERPDELMEVHDAGNDPRFSDNRFVTGEPKVRFYAGMPLVTPAGAAIGTVCVLDREPRRLSDEQRAGLGSLARLTMALFDARQRERDAERAALLEQRSDEATPPTAAAVAAQATAFTVALFEVQDFAGASRRLGDRAMERALQRFDDVMHGLLRPGSADSVNRATGSAETIVVLRGDDNAAAFQRLRDAMPAFERETSLRVLAAAAAADSPQERIEAVFMRADAALSDEKDAEATRRQD
jgi:GAF domain-containing protein